MTSALDGGGWSSHPGRLYPQERPGTRCTGGSCINVGIFIYYVRNCGCVLVQTPTWT